MTNLEQLREACARIAEAHASMAKDIMDASRKSSDLHGFYDAYGHAAKLIEQQIRSLDIAQFEAPTLTDELKRLGVSEPTEEEKFVRRAEWKQKQFDTPPATDLDTLARQQGVGPVDDVSKIMGGFEDLPMPDTDPYCTGRFTGNRCHIEHDED
jgi:hypothetical protein